MTVSDWPSLLAWWHSVPPSFAFLLALPFVVGAAGLLASRRARRRPGPASR